MSFYQKYRVPILIGTTLLTSVVVAIAIDKIMKRVKGGNVVKVNGTYRANSCDELHAFEGTHRRTIGGMNTKINAELEKYYKAGKNPIVSKVNVTMDAKNMKVDWEVEITESKDKKAWVGFTSRGSSGNASAFERAVSPSTGQDPATILSKLKKSYNDPSIELKKVYELFYNMSDTGKVLGNCATRQVFYAYTKPKNHPSI
jgi:hypothetical protein